MKSSSSNITYKGVDMYVEFDYSEYRPAVYYLSNGDPGYPAEGGEFEITSVQVGKEGIQIGELLSDDDYAEIEQIIINNYEEL